MKEQWVKLYVQLEQHADHLTEFAKNVQDKIANKNIKRLAEGYNKLLQTAEQFGKMVEPIEPKIVELPFKTEEFAETWKNYKEYLLEQHQVHIASRTEIFMLNKLRKWANKSQSKAIDILEFLAINRYKSFFCPSEKQLTGEELPAAEQSASTINLNIDKNAGV